MEQQEVSRDGEEVANRLISLINDIAYTRKEKLVESLNKMLDRSGG